MSLTKTTLFVSLFAAGAMTACSSNASLTVVNDESFSITELYVDDPGDDAFSDNLLGDEPLDPGDSITLDVSCGNYDVEIIDETGDDCKVFDVSLCFNDSEWDINDDFCQFTTSRSDPNAKHYTVPRIKGNATAARAAHAKQLTSSAEPPMSFAVHR